MQLQQDLGHIALAILNHSFQVQNDLQVDTKDFFFYMFNAFVFALHQAGMEMSCCILQLRNCLNNDHQNAKYILNTCLSNKGIQYSKRINGSSFRNSFFAVQMVEPLKAR